MKPPVNFRSPNRRDSKAAGSSFKDYRIPRTSASISCEKATAARTTDTEGRKKDFSFSLLPREQVT